MLDLFTPVVSEDKLHPNFIRVAITARPEVKAILLGWSDGFVDRDNKLVTEFQTVTTGAEGPPDHRNHRAPGPPPMIWAQFFARADSA